jgi:hypothetical protein
MEGPNPYAAPVADFGAPAPAVSGDHEATRQRLIKAETNIKSIGSLMLLGGVFILLSAIRALERSGIEAGIALVTAVLALFVGIKLRQLATIGRTMYTGLAGLAVLSEIVAFALAPGSSLVGVIVFRLGIVALFLSVLWNKNASEVFTDHYRTVVIPATPHVKYKTSTAAVVVLIILVALFVGLIAWAVVGK